MNLRFTNDWLRRRIETDADIECEAGLPLRDATSIEGLVRQDAARERPATESRPVVLSLLIRQLRRRDQMTHGQLADRLSVASEDIKRMEEEPGYVPGPRTMHKIATYVKVPTTAVQRLATSIDARNDNVKEAALKFAASSDDLSALSSTERQGLNDFVKVLAEYKAD